MWHTKKYYQHYAAELFGDIDLVERFHLMDQQKKDDLLNYARIREAEAEREMELLREMLVHSRV